MNRSDQIDELRREAIGWTLRLKPGVATADDVATFRNWCRQDPAHARAFVEARQLWAALGPAGQKLFDLNALEALAGSGARSRLIGRRAFIGGAAAASVAAGYAAVHPPLHLWPSLAELNADYRTALGEQQRIALPNDVAIEMNTQTAIALLRPAGDNIDRVELIAGESAVRVQSHMFEVLAGNGRTAGENAAFNVRRDGDRVSVTCLEGEVSVSCGRASAVLTPHRQVAYSREGLASAATVDSSAVISWREGVLVFRDTQLDELIAEINRYRRGRIVVVGEGLRERIVSGRFYLSRLDEVIEKVRNAFGAHVTSLPGGVVILS